MKKTILTLLTLAAVFAGGNALAAPTGDIYDIAPTDMFGNEISKSKLPLYSADKSMITGEKAYFKLRMLARENTTERWNMVYTGLSSSDFYPFQLGIFVSGKLTYATYVGKLEYGGLITDFIFEYETQAGDFALPIVLAVNSSSGPVPASDSRAENTGSYYPNPLRSDWEARFNMSDGSYVTADWWVMGSAPFPIGTTIERHNDYSLANSGFCVKTVDFSSTWQTNGVVWRSVHENSTNCDKTPQLVATPATDKPVTLYVWSTNEESVVVYGSNVRSVTMPDPDDITQTKTYQVGEITFAKGETTQNFSLKGVSCTANDGWAGLVLSAYNHFNVSDANQDLIIDFVSVPVRCVEPLPPSVIIEAETYENVKATSDYKTAANRLTIRLSEPSTTQFKVKVTPKLSDGTDISANWGDYVRFSKTDQVVSTLPDAEIPEITLGGDVMEGTLYVFCLRSDEHTTGVNQLQFKTSLSSGTPTPAIDPDNYGMTGFNVSAQNPEIIVPYENQVLEETIIAGEEAQLTLKIADTYADMQSSDGYEIWVKYRVGKDPFVKLDGKYKPGDGGILYRLDGTTLTSDLPVLTYAAPGENKSQIYIKSPVSGKDSRIDGDARNFTANVQAARSSNVETVDGESAYNEGVKGGIGFKITISEPNDTGAPLYAFLKPSDNIADLGIFSGTTPFIIGMTNTAGKCNGLVINQTKDSAKGTVQLLDGWNPDEGGLNAMFEVVLATVQDYATATNQGKIVKGYQSNILELTFNNVEPVIKYVELNGIPSEYSGYKFSQQVPKGQDQVIHAKITDVAYDLKNTVQPFKCKWTPYINGIAQTPTEVEGDPETNPFVYNFPRAGEYKIRLQVKDKDMSDWSDTDYEINVTALANPTITVVPSEENPDENATKNYVTVGLTYFDADQDLHVKLEVVSGQAGGGAEAKIGELVLDSNYRSTVPGEENIYYLTFSDGTPQDILIERMDGTDVSDIKGFYIKASVIDETENPKTHERWCDYYVANNSTRVFPKNVAPNDADIKENTFSPEANSSTNRWEVAGGSDTTHPLKWKVYRDVDKDFENGIKVTIVGGGGESYNGDGFVNGVKTVYEEASGVFIPNFSSQGDQQVMITIEDKDGGVLSRTWYFTVAPSKYLETTANGPGGGTTTSQLSQKYVAASGIGSGHVWVEGATFTEATAFRLNWNCSKDVSKNIYAWGYKLAKPKDDGSLDAHDIAINKDGTAQAGVTVADPYVYADENGRDSFFYTWIKTTTDAESGETTTALMGSIAPERPLAGSAAGNVVLASEQLESGNYLDTKVEAIFAKEYLPSDNMGDINFDRIPDLYYQKYQFTTETETVNNGPQGGTTTEETTAADLDAVADYNEDADYLPSTLTASAGSIAPGLAGSWVTVGLPFTADLEIRGYGDALNDAPALAGVTGVKPDRIYTDPDLDYTKSVTNVSTLTKVEYLAWKEYAVAHGMDPDFPANWTKWSPERPTDPTKEDTDGDGFSDGYEYFFWYRAHVGWLDIQSMGSVQITNHCYQTGRRFNPRNPGVGTLITSEEIEELMDPLAKSADSAAATTRDTDNDGLPDLVEFALGTNPFDFDSDGDGLSDGWEVLTGSDPLLAGTDASANADGDAMAWTVTYFAKNNSKEAMCPEASFREQMGLPLDGMDYWKTFAVADEAGDSDGVQWYAVHGNTEVTTYLEDSSVPVATFFYYTGSGLLSESSSWVQVATTLTVLPTTDEGRLARNLTVDETFKFDDEGGVVVKGLPTRIAKGTFVKEFAPAGTYSVRKLEASLEDKDCAAAWQYGRYRLLVDGVLKQVLTLGRSQGVESNVVVVANVDNSRPLAHIHHFVYQDFGFDPRTAWNPNGTLGERWTSIIESDGVKQVDSSVRSGSGYAGVSARTKAFTAYDEFLLMSFFLNNGAISESSVTPTTSSPWAAIYQKYTTNPVGPGQTTVAADTSSSSNAVDVVTGVYGENGADTDNDGVPDGWELYVMSGPKGKDGLYVTASPMSAMSPLNTAFESGTDKDASSIVMTDEPMDKDSLSERQEYAGTDSCGYYSEIQIGNTAAYSSTIVRPSEHVNWLNKFFPTDPWSKDTDGDGLADAAEFSSFVYGSPSDDYVNGLKPLSIPGGGLNPCSVDTDADGLPDGWEVQFAGKTQYTGESSTNSTVAASSSNSVNQVGLMDGMDGTVFDAYTRPGDPINRDYDRDGLENWQEYLVGTMRCWRYDDPWTPWYGIPADTYFDAAGNFDVAGAVTKLGLADEEEFWYKTLICKTNELYNPQLVTDMSSGALYFSRITNTWDRVYRSADDKAGSAYYVFKDRVGNASYKEIWTAYYGLPEEHNFNTAPMKYISCDPTRADSDGDGLDDYYELFHGLNPLLGADGVEISDDGACDIVYDAWYKTNVGSPVSALANFWRGYNDDYDFVKYPFLNGMATADPDGDDIRNQVEGLMPMVAPTATWLHTDPTPLWMTDATYSNSLTRQFWRLPNRTALPNEEGGIIVPESITYGDSVYYTRDCDGYIYEKKTEGLATIEVRGLGYFAPESWQLTATDAENWMFSFEQNEGYDTDHDAIGDYDEKEARLNAGTDPQHFDSPRRRQAMYFQGPAKKSALQTMPQVLESHPQGGTSYPDEMAFLRYTVECWAYPESTADSTLIERDIWSDRSAIGDQEFMRRNFQIALKNGHWYTKFDPNGTLAYKPVEVMSVAEAKVGAWTHLAATYDGQQLILYVNGVAEPTANSGLQPEYGASAVAVKTRPGQDMAYWFCREYSWQALVVGASAKGMQNGGTFRALDLTQGIGLNGYQDFYKGWIDEIRIWDGARTGDQIRSTMRTRFTDAELNANRDEFYSQWFNGERRYDKDGSGTDYNVVPELRYHYSFDSVPGAENEAQVAKVPAGFNNASGKAALNRPDDYKIAWWDLILQSYGSVYSDPGWVTWIPNAVAHLPRFDGTTLDSMYWSEDFRGDVAGTFKFARTAEPVSFWTQMMRNQVAENKDYQSTAARHFLVNSTAGGNFATLFEFTGRHTVQLGDDLLPLGGAYARYCDETVGLWDDDGPSTNWEITGDDDDGNGLPQWWEDYANSNYSPEGALDWNTMVTVDGYRMRAGEAYLRDIAKGFYANASGTAVEGSSKFAQVADANGVGVPDWWMELYGIKGESALDDHDHDGLPNYVEYLLSEVFKFQGIRFSPVKANSVDPYTPDYFFKVGDLYAGEIFTDHDQVDDLWEDQYPTLNDGVTKFASRLEYDAFADADEDGWSNRSEVRYAQQSLPIVANQQYHYSVSDGLVADYPIPTLALTVRYNGTRQSAVSEAAIVVQATTDYQLSGDYQATWNVAGATAKSAASGQSGSSQQTTASTTYARNLGKWANRHMVGTLTPGNIAYGSLAFEFCSDPSSSVYSWQVTDTTGNVTVHRGELSQFTADQRKFGSDRVTICSSTNGYSQVEGLTLSTDESGTVATWTHNASGTKFGTVNLVTGAFDMDLSVLEGSYLISSNSVSSMEDQNFRIAYTANASVGMPRKLYLGEADKGALKEGKNVVIAFADLNGDGAYTAGEPYGFVKDVDVSWRGTSAAIELTDTSPVFARINLVTGESDRAAGFNETVDIEDAGGNVMASAAKTRVRIFRWKQQALSGETDFFTASTLSAADRVTATKCVFDRLIDLNERPYLTEADILLYPGNEYDLDWKGPLGNSAENTSGNLGITAVSYRIYFGDESADTIRGNISTNLFPLAVMRKFDGLKTVSTKKVSCRQVPQVIAPAAEAQVVYSASPTFEWSMFNESEGVERNTYTAFRIVVKDGATEVYDSGLQLAPPHNASGNYEWTPALYAGDIAPGKTQAFVPGKSYDWTVNMYNSVWPTDVTSGGTNKGTFFLNTQTNGYQTGNVNVAVKYFGPALSYSGKKIRVRAFTSPDFTGRAIAGGYVAAPNDAETGVAVTGKVVKANCKIIGIPKGTYYLQAFIDSNDNGVCEPWESSGYLCRRDGSSADYLNPTALSFGTELGESDLVTIYIEDADTDGDGLPDAWEMAKNKSLTVEGAELLSQMPAGEFVVNKTLSGTLSLQSGASTPAAGLAGRALLALDNAGTLALALGVDTTGYESFAAAISGSVSEELAEDGVVIRKLTIADGKIQISVEAETEAQGVNSPLATAVTGSSELVVKCYVAYSTSLSGEWSDWQFVQNITVGAGEVDVDVSSAIPSNLAESCFIKVKLEK